MIKLLESLKSNWQEMNGKNIGFVNQATFFTDSLMLEEFKQICSWLLDNGAKFHDDSHKNQSNTYHLWLSLPAVTLYCGLIDDGSQADEIKMQHALTLRKISEKTIDLN